MGNPGMAVIACGTCGLVQSLGEVPPGALAECARCGIRLTRRIPHSIARTAALALAALAFYGPANLYPILQMDLYGLHSDNTVWQGCVSLFEHGDRFVAAIVFLASIAIPFLKLVGLFVLVATVKLRSRTGLLARARIFRTLEIIGPWSMLDVFLLAVLVSLVKLRELATVLPGPGLFAFTAVVVLTILATGSFDPRLIWEPDEAP